MIDTSLILLIDDSQEDRDYYSRRLLVSSPHFEIAHAATGQSGLALCRGHRFDCILLELDLPDMSGFEVLVNICWTSL
jgi:CheY-like chemotaxis protein